MKTLQCKQRPWRAVKLPVTLPNFKFNFDFKRMTRGVVITILSFQEKKRDFN